MTLVSAPSKLFNAAVIGAGPAGLAVVSRLLDLVETSATPYSILWIDPVYEGGRLAAYKQVPSNTKVKLFLKFVQVSNSLNKAFQLNRKLVSHMNTLDQNTGCSLVNAQQLTMELARNLKLVYPACLSTINGHVTDIQFSNDQYNLSIDYAEGYDTHSNKSTTVSASDLYLCTGSEPVVGEYHLMSKNLSIGYQVEVLDLDTCLNPSKLDTVIKSFRHSHPGENVRVAVIGSSHSAVLCLMNLTQQNVPVVNIYRNRFKYAQEIKSEIDPNLDFILFDNTGLKGMAAEFAKSYLEDESSLAKLNIIRLEAPALDQEEQFYNNLWISGSSSLQSQTDRITHVVYSIGYKSSPVPPIFVNGQQVQNLAHDPQSGYLSCSKTNIDIPRMRGFGIAFPEQVVDPYGNVEWSVGMWKFQRYVQKVIQF